MEKCIIELNEENCRKDEFGNYKYIEGKLNDIPFSRLINNTYEDIYGRINIGDYMYKKGTRSLVEVSSVYPLEVMREFLDPIAISREILDRMGFVCIGNCNYINENCRIILKFISDGDCDMYFINKEVHYVNELQNISVVMFNKKLTIL